MFCRSTLGAWAFVLALPAFAQHSGHTAAPAPQVSPQASTPQPPPAAQAAVGTASSPSRTASDQRYVSSFENYRRFADEPLQSWKASNDRVGQIGGWRTYAKEAAGADAPLPSAATAPAHQSAGQPDKTASEVKPPRPAAVQTPQSPSAPAPKASGGHSQHQ